MANSLVSHNVHREKRALKPIEAKGKGEVQILQIANSETEAEWIAKKIKELWIKACSRAKSLYSSSERKPRRPSSRL
jgi:superfamily I DNA/RNA helicase